jgi:hypothetical protein
MIGLVTVFVTLMSIDIRGTKAVIILIVSIISFASILTYFIRDLHVKYGILIGTFPPLIFLIYGTWTDYVSTHKKEEESVSVEAIKFDLNTEINSLNSSTTDNFTIQVTSDTIRKGENSSGRRVNSFQLNFNEFNILKLKEWNKSITKSKFEIVNDTTFILYLGTGNIIKKRLIPSKNGVDSVSYLGYLPQQGLFIFAENVSERGPDYTSIDAATGQVIDGIPLYISDRRDLYGSVLFRHYLGQLEVPVKIWRRENKHYQLIYQDEIELSGQYYNYSKFIISDAKWDKQDFKFNLHVDLDSIKLRLRVLGL